MMVMMVMMMMMMMMTLVSAQWSVLLDEAGPGAGPDRAVC